MNTWEVAILKCMRSIGDEAPLQRIYENIDNFKELTKNHLKSTVHGGRPAFQHQLRKHISNMCKANDLKWVSTGHYSITEKGLKRISS